MALQLQHQPVVQLDVPAQKDRFRHQLEAYCEIAMLSFLMTRTCGTEQKHICGHSSGGTNQFALYGLLFHLSHRDTHVRFSPMVQSNQVTSAPCRNTRSRRSSYRIPTAARHGGTENGVQVEIWRTYVPLTSTTLQDTLRTAQMMLPVGSLRLRTISKAS